MKKIISVLLLLSLVISLCSCEKSTNTQKSETFSSIQMKMNILESLIKLDDTNGTVISALNDCIEGDNEAAKTKYIAVLDEFKDVESKIEETINSPNFIETGLKELIKNTEDTIDLLKSEMSDEEDDRLLELEKEAKDLHLGLIKSLQCFSNLYSIREFDQLSDEESDKRLEEYWEEFRFEDDIKCPDNIEEYELYLIWAKQFSDEFVETEEITKELESLRKNDCLDSKESNKKWVDFIQNYIFLVQKPERPVLLRIFYINKVMKLYRGEVKYENSNSNRRFKRNRCSSRQRTCKRKI